MSDIDIERMARVMASQSTGGIVGPNDPSLAWADWVADAREALTSMDTAPINTAREIAAELWNAVDGEGDIPMSLLKRTLTAYGITFEPCPSCGRVNEDHAPYCPDGQRCDVCGQSACPSDHYEPGEIA